MPAAPAMAFVFFTNVFAVWLVVFCLAGVLLMAGEEELAAAVALLLTAWLIAVAVKKRDPFGPLNYVALHGSFFVGLLAGAMITRIRDPQDYPLDADDSDFPLRLDAARQGDDFALSSGAALHWIKPQLQKTGKGESDE
jgi:hypothetical protein